MPARQSEFDRNRFGQVIFIFICSSDQRSIMLLFHVKSTPGRCWYSSLTRLAGAITVKEEFRECENR